MSRKLRQEASVGEASVGAASVGEASVGEETGEVEREGRPAEEAPPAQTPK
jgi:hypothetical protein